MNEQVSLANDLTEKQTATAIRKHYRPKAERCHILTPITHC